MLANRSGISAMKGYLSPNRGVVVRKQPIWMGIGGYLAFGCTALCTLTVETLLTE